MKKRESPDFRSPEVGISVVGKKLKIQDPSNKIFNFQDFHINSLLSFTKVTGTFESSFIKNQKYIYTV